MPLLYNLKMGADMKSFYFNMYITLMYLTTNTAE
jgi:hypothetical protein